MNLDQKIYILWSIRTKRKTPLQFAPKIEDKIEQELIKTESLET